MVQWDADSSVQQDVATASLQQQLSPQLCLGAAAATQLRVAGGGHHLANGKWGKSWENHGKIMGKSWEYHGNIMGLSWEYHGII